MAATANVQVKSINFVHPGNYLRFGIDGQTKLKTLKRCTRGDLIALGRNIFKVELTGTRDEIQGELEARMEAYGTNQRLNQYPRDVGSVTLSLRTGLFQFVLCKDGVEFVSSKSALKAGSVEVIGAALGLWVLGDRTSSRTMKDGVENIMNHLLSLKPRDFPLTFHIPTRRRCAHAECRRTLDESRLLYCTRHQRQEAIATYLDRYTAEDNVVGMKLAELLLNEPLIQQYLPLLKTALGITDN